MEIVVGISDFFIVFMILFFVNVNVMKMVGNSLVL